MKRNSAVLLFLQSSACSDGTTKCFKKNSILPSATSFKLFSTIGRSSGISKTQEAPTKLEKRHQLIANIFCSNPDLQVQAALFQGTSLFFISCESEPP